MTHVFIIPEPHIWDKTFKNRVDYPQEVYGYLNEIISHIKSYASEEIIILFPGDVFHRSFTSLSGLVKVFNLFTELDNLSNSHVYSCVGNHELSYPFFNPFWMLAKDSTSRYTNMQHLDGYGSIRHGINIVDDLTVGKLKFIMGHYERTNLVDASDKDLVLISHNSIIEPEVNNYLQQTLGRSVNSEYMNTIPLRSSNAIPLVGNLKYVFVGHMHTFYSNFTVDEDIQGVHMNFQLQYLGSLGRTAINEVNDTDLERIVPHFVVDTQGNYTYEPFKLKLKPRSEVVIEEIVVANQKAYSREKAVKQLKESNVFGESAREAIINGLQPFPIFSDLFQQVYNNNLNADIVALLQEAKTL